VTPRILDIYLDGTQGDNLSTPRMARAIAKTSLQLTGKDCVNDSFELLQTDDYDGSAPLNSDLVWSVLVDGVEEAESTRSNVDVFLSGLEIGQHHLESK
jgi:hypothetical protein